MSSANKTTWKTTGEDQVYLYHKLIEDPNLEYATFEGQHADWITKKGYLKRNLRTNFLKSKDRLKKFYSGECKFCCVFILFYIYLFANK